MKKTIIFLLTAMLLISFAPDTQAQKKKKLTATEANELLKKTLGDWQINLLTWQPEFKNYKETKGRSSFSTSHKSTYVHEKFNLENLNGKAQEGEGFIRYSEEHKRFELVQLDNTGKSMLLMVGEWSPEHNVLTFKPIDGHDQWGSSGSLPLQYQYFFLEDGSIKKLIRTPNADGNYIIAYQLHYVRPGRAEL